MSVTISVFSLLGVGFTGNGYANEYISLAKVCGQVLENEMKLLWQFNRVIVFTPGKMDSAFSISG